MIYSCLGIAVLVVMSLYNLLTAIHLECPQPEDGVIPAPPRRRVSLLIPVRNEARNLPRLLQCLSEIDYAPLEIIFLNDESTDDTARILRSSGYAALNGAKTPEGWVGKNWACHQLAQAATGDLLIFCDADVSLGPRAVADSVQRLHEFSADALTALPRQTMRSWSEQAVIPLVMHQSVTGLLPLNLLHQLRSPSLLVCNGQWLCLDRATYFLIGGHRQVKGSFLEDMALGRGLKKGGYRLLTVVAAESLTVRMYQNLDSLKEGFTKNLYPLMGGSVPVFLLCLLLFLFCNAASCLSLPGFLLLVLNRVIVARIFKSSFRSSFAHPLGLVLVLYLAIRSLAKTKWGVIKWKGREVGGERV